MKKEMRKLVSVLCLLTVMLTPCQIALASDDAEIAPMMTYIVDYTIGFTLSSDTARVEADVDGDVLNATRTKVIAELQVKNGSDWIPVAIWTDDQYFYTAGIDETHSVVEGHTYRVKATFTVWEGSASETVTSYSSEKIA